MSGDKDEPAVCVSCGKPAIGDCDPNEVVGHKTFSDSDGGYRHEPLTRSEADVLHAAIDANDKRIAALMPDEDAARRMFCDAYHRLEEFGWRPAIYCPKDGSQFSVIEAGSSGVHVAHYEGEWPKGSWWIHDEGDQWPSRPSLFRLLAKASGAT